LKVLVTRTDRLGDLVLSLPVFGLLAGADPGGEVHAMVAPAAVPLVANDPHLARVWTWHDGLSGRERQDLRERLRAEHFDAVVMLQYRRPLAALLWRVGIGLRCGPLSHWSSWLLLNRGLRQNRSAGGCHEMVYNSQLAQHLLAATGGASGTATTCPPRLHLSAPQRQMSEQFRAEEVAPGAEVVFLHPGSGGSALDWEPERFAAVANALAESPARQVFVTGAGSDAAVVSAMRATLSPAVRVLLDRYDLEGLLAVLAAGDLFIGPSTGPLHLAAALGVPTLGLFPPVRAMHPDRWGQRGAPRVESRHIVPEVACPARHRCQGERCRFHSCMDKIQAQTVIAAALDILGEDKR